MIPTHVATDPTFRCVCGSHQHKGEQMDSCFYLSKLEYACTVWQYHTRVPSFDLVHES